MGFPKTTADIASVRCIAAIMVKELKTHAESPFFVKAIPLINQRVLVENISYLDI